MLIVRTVVFLPYCAIYSHVKPTGITIHETDDSRAERKEEACQQKKSGETTEKVKRIFQYFLPLSHDDQALLSGILYSG